MIFEVVPLGYPAQNHGKKTRKPVRRSVRLPGRERRWPVRGRLLGRIDAVVRRNIVQGG